MKLEGTKVYLRYFVEEDTEELLNFELKNRNFFKQYLTPRNDEFYTYEYQQKLINNSCHLVEKDRQYLFGIYDNSTKVLVGKIVLFNIMRGPMQSCEVGCYIGFYYNDKGYSTEANRLVIKFALDELLFHRVVIYIAADSQKSMHVMDKLGFQREGLVREYVKLNGKWVDHYLYSIISKKDN